MNQLKAEIKEQEKYLEKLKRFESMDENAQTVSDLITAVFNENIEVLKDRLKGDFEYVVLVRKK